MYPQRELAQLAAHKAALRRNIALHRAECVAAAARVARPLAWLDRVVALWRRLSPLAAISLVPLGLLLKRTFGPRLRILASLVKWGPLVFGAVRGVSAAVKARGASARS